MTSPRTHLAHALYAAHLATEGELARALGTHRVDARAQHEEWLATAQSARARAEMLRPPTLAERIEAAADAEDRQYSDTLAYEVAACVGLTADDLGEDDAWGLQALRDVGVGTACELVAVAMIARAERQAADCRVEAAEAREADVQAWRRDVL